LEGDSYLTASHRLNITFGEVIRRLITEHLPLITSASALTLGITNRSRGGGELSRLLGEMRNVSTVFVADVPTERSKLLFPMLKSFPETQWIQVNLPPGFDEGSVRTLNLGRFLGER
jgi:hypothetical protein